MNIENKTPNLSLSKDKTDIYYKVGGLSLQTLFYARNGYFPGCYLFDYNSRSSGYEFEVEKFKDFLFENVPDDEEMEYIPYITRIIGKDGCNKESLGFCVILNKSNIYARIESSILDSYILFSNDQKDEMYKFVNELFKFFNEPAKKDVSFYTLQRGQTGFSLLESKVKVYKDFNLKKQYNDNLEKEDKKISDFIAKNDESGLIILHGEKGTGKTTYIRHLINKFNSKKFIYIPSSMIPVFGDPSFASFLNTLSNSVIILEDCEDAIRDRKTSNTGSAVSLILNMTDGLLGDNLGLKFICTFNEDVKNIDSALTRKGRLVSKYEFKKLSVEKTNNLLKELAMDENPYLTEDKIPVSSKELSLCEIYYYNEDSYENNKTTII